MKWQFEKYLVLEEEQRRKKMALKLVIFASIAITLIKAYAVTLTHSNAILSDLLESMVNLFASAFALFSLVYSGKPRDQRYPFGHGKIEFLVAAIEGGIIFIVGLIIIGKAIYNLFHPHPITNLDYGILLVCGGAIANLILGGFLYYKAKKLSSIVLSADSKRLLSDALSSVALVVGLLVIYFTDLVWIDSAIAILSSFLILRTGFLLMKKSLMGLLDATDQKLQQSLLDVLKSNETPSWIDIKSIRVSDHRMYLYMHCDIVMPRYWTLEQIHDEVKQAELLLNNKFKERVDLVIQPEPCKPMHCSICKMQNCHLREKAHSRKQLSPPTPSVYPF